MTAAVLDPPTADPLHDNADQTAEDLLAVSKASSHRYELMKGALQTMSPAGAKHGQSHQKEELPTPSQQAFEVKTIGI